MSQLDGETIQRLFSGVSFFNELKRQDEAQWQLLIEHCQVLELAPGEVLIQRDERDPHLYFLLRGQLAVYADNIKSGDILNYISPGEVFGALAMLRDNKRSACIVVDEASKGAIVAKLSGAEFQDLHNFNHFTLATKISFYRMLVHNIRWTLEVIRMQDPHHPAVVGLRKVPIFSGEKGTVAELEALNTQAHALADLLYQWNQMFQPSTIQLT